MAEDGITWENLLNLPEAISLSNEQLDVFARAAGYIGERPLDVAVAIFKLPKEQQKNHLEAFLSGLLYLYRKQPLDSQSLQKAFLADEISAYGAAELSLANNVPKYLQTEDIVARFFHGIFK